MRLPVRVPDELRNPETTERKSFGDTAGGALALKLGVVEVLRAGNAW